MNREQFLWELRVRLEDRVPPQYLEEVMAYYTAYFDDAGPEREAEVIAGLGGPAQVARQILGEAALRNMNPQGRRRSGLGTLGLVLLALFASPVAIPLAIAAAAVAVAMVAAILAVFVGLIGAGAVCVLAGILAAAVGFGQVLTHWATTMYLLGGGMVSAGLGLLLIAGSLWLCGLAIGGVTRMVGRVLHGRRGRQ